MRIQHSVALVVGAYTLATTLTCFANSPNQNARAYLSWSNSDTTNINLTTPGANNNLFILFRQDLANGNGTGLEFKGGEIDIIWSANETIGPACFEHIGTQYKTSTACTYLNRGAAVAIPTFDDPGHFHVAWANPTALTGCTLGVGVLLQFAFDGCVGVTPSGTFELTSVRALDAQNIPVSSDDPSSMMAIGGRYAYVNHNSPVQATTWGAIKRQFGR